jgi:hypothetical protein
LKKWNITGGRFNEDLNQCDQIERIFAHGRLFTLGSFFKSTAAGQTSCNFSRNKTSKFWSCFNNSNWSPWSQNKYNRVKVAKSPNNLNFAVDWMVQDNTSIELFMASEEFFYMYVCT